MDGFELKLTSQPGLQTAQSSQRRHKTASASTNSERALLLRFFCVVAILVGIAGLVSLSSADTSVEAYKKFFLHPYELRPEPLERAIFLAFVAALIPVTLFTHGVADAASRRQLPGWMPIGRPLKSMHLLSVAFLLCGLFLSFWESYLASWIFPTPPLTSSHWALYSFVALLTIATPTLLRLLKIDRTSRSIFEFTLMVMGVIGVSACFLMAAHDLWNMPLPLAARSGWFAVSLCLAFVPAVLIASEYSASGSLVAFAKVILLAAGVTGACTLLLGIQNASFAVPVQPKWHSHFEAVFYATGQVVGGKTVLADLPSQYGLFPEILGLFLRWTGVTVAGFTVLMVCLTLLVFITLGILCRDLIRNKWLAVLAFMSLLSLVGGTWSHLVVANADPYYQYRPIRYLFPVAATLLFWRVSAKQLSIPATCLCGLFAGTAILWNLDSGIPVFGAMLLPIALRSASTRWNWSQGVAVTASYLMAAVVAIAAFALYLQFKSSRSIDFLEVFRYQDLFYRAGYFMLPMPIRPSPWMAVLGSYVFGIVYALRLYRQARPTRLTELVLFLSIVGIGLFAYYQGRSHELNLAAVMWPAVLLLFIFADRSLRLYKAGAGLTSLLLAAPAILFGALSVWTLLFNLAVTPPKVPSHVMRLVDPPVTSVTENIEFVRYMAGDAKEVVIIAPSQAIYFAETGLVSAVGGPGIAELILKEDETALLQRILSRRPQHVFLQGAGDTSFSKPYLPLFSEYQIDAESPSGLLHLSPIRR